MTNAIDREYMSQTQESQHTILFDALPQGIMVIDSSLNILYANESIEILGFVSDQIQNRSLKSLYDDRWLNFEDRVGISRDNLIHQLHENLSMVGDYFYEHEGQLYHFQRLSTPFNRMEQRGWILQFFDRSEASQIEQARESMTQMIVHDLRSPLTAVIASFRLIQEVISKDHESRPTIEKIMDTSERSIRKVLRRANSLLDISKIRSGKMDVEYELVEVSYFFNTVQTELLPLAQALQVELIYHVPENLPLLRVDKDKVERMFLNLVDNALKYSPADTTVSLRAMPLVDREKGQTEMLIQVADQGKGIADADKERLFDPYTQLINQDNSRHGVGLGLTFCKLVVEAHQGNIWVEDNLNGGSIFIFTLPIYEE